MKILFEIDYSQKNFKFINKFDDCYGINCTGNSASLGFKIADEKIYL